MIRSAPLRRTPLARQSRLPASVVPLRRTRLAPRSERRRAGADDRRRVFGDVLARDGGCLLASWASHRCTGPLTPHHLAKASACGPFTLDNLVVLCGGGNGWVEDAPLMAARLGLVVRAGIDHDEAARRRVHHGIVPGAWRG